VPELGQGSHLIGVTVRGRRIRVSIDGKQVLSAQLGANVIPPAVLVAFTGATGSLAGSQTAGSAAVTAAGRRLPAPGGGWSFNGTAAMSGSSALLTRRLDSEAGSVVYPTAVPTDGLKVTFTAQIYGGTGATGLSFALLNPSDSSSTSLGGSGGSQGVGGLDGMAVVLNTVKQDQYSNGNMVQIAESGTGGLSILNEAEGIPPLRPGPNTVTIAISSVAGSAIMTVWLDGGQILRQAVPTLTATALLAFTGATGARTDFHLVRDVAISAAR